MSKLVPQTLKNQSLFGERLMDRHTENIVIKDDSCYGRAQIITIFCGSLSMRGSRYLSRGGGCPTENALVLLYDTLISGFQWM